VEVLLSGFSTQGTPCVGFNHWAQPVQTTEPCLFTPSPELGTRMKSHTRPPSIRQTRDVNLPSKDGSYVNIIVLMSYQGHPYPWTDNTINPEVTRPPCQAKVMSAYLSWCPTLVIGWQCTLRWQQATTSWVCLYFNELDLRRYPGTYPRLTVHQVRHMGCHAWIRGNDSIQVYPLKWIWGDKM
jgi:hypothetical protein